MSSIVKEAARLMEALPESDQEFAYAFIKKLILAWDPDFTKVPKKRPKESTMRKTAAMWMMTTLIGKTSGTTNDCFCSRTVYKQREHKTT